MTVIEQMLASFHEKCRHVISGTNAKLLKDAEQFFDNLKKKVPLGFDVCHANLFAATDESEILFCTQLLSWYCKHNNLTNEQFQRLVSATSCYLNCTSSAVLTQLLSCCSAAICRQYISAALLGRNSALSTTFTNSTNFPVDIVIRLMNFIPEFIRNRDIWQGLKGTASYSDDNADSLIRVMLSDSANVINLFDSALSLTPSQIPRNAMASNYQQLLPLEVLTCCMHWMRLQIHVSTTATKPCSEEEHWLWCLVWKNARLIPRIYQFLDTVTTEPSACGDPSLFQLYRETINVLTAYCCLICRYDNEKDFSENYLRQNNKFPQRQRELMQHTVNELMPFLSKLLSQSLETCGKKFSEFNSALNSSTPSYHGISLYTDMDRAFLSTCCSFKLSVFICCGCCTPMLLFLVPLIEEQLRKESSGSAHNGSPNSSSLHVPVASFSTLPDFMLPGLTKSTGFAEWSNFLTALSNSILGFVQGQIADSSVAFKAKWSNVNGVAPHKLALFRTVELQQRKHCMELLASIQSSIFLPLARIQQLVNSTQDRPAVASSSEISLTTLINKFSVPCLPPLNVAVSNPAIAPSFPLLSNTMKTILFASVIVSRCLSDCPVSGDCEEDIEDEIVHFRTTFRDNLREVTSACSGFLIWILETSIDFLAPVVSLEPTDLTLETCKANCAIGANWVPIEAQLHACTAITKNILELLRKCFHEDDLKRQMSQFSQPQFSAMTSPIGTPQSRPSPPVGSPSSSKVAGQGVHTTCELLQLTEKLIFLILHDNIAFCRPSSRMVVLLTSDLLPELQLLIRDRLAPSASNATAFSSGLLTSNALNDRNNNSELSAQNRCKFAKAFTTLALQSLRAVLLSLVIHKEERDLPGHQRDAATLKCGWNLAYRTKQDHIGAVGLMKLIPAVVALPRPQIDNGDGPSVLFNMGIGDFGGRNPEKCLVNCCPVHVELALSQSYLMIQHPNNLNGPSQADLHLIRSSYVDMINLFIQPENTSLIVGGSVLPITTAAILSSYWHLLFTTRLMTQKTAAQMTLKSFIIAQEACAAALALLHVGNNRDATPSNSKKAVQSDAILMANAAIEAVVLTTHQCDFIAKSFVCAAGQILGPFFGAILFTCSNHQQQKSYQATIQLRDSMYARLVNQLLGSLFSMSQAYATLTSTSKLIGFANSSSTPSATFSIPILNRVASLNPDVRTVGESDNSNVQYTLQTVSCGLKELDEMSLSACHWLGERIGLLAADVVARDSVVLVAQFGIFCTSPNQIIIPLLTNILESIMVSWKSKISPRDIVPCFDAKMIIVENYLLPVLELLLSEYSDPAYLTRDRDRLTINSQRYDMLHVICRLISASVSCLYLTPVVAHTLREYSLRHPEAQTERLTKISQLFGRFVALALAVLNTLSQWASDPSASPLEHCSAVADIGIKLSETVLKTLCSWQPLANISDIFALLFQSITNIGWQCVLAEYECFRGGGTSPLQWDVPKVKPQTQQQLQQQPSQAGHHKANPQNPGSYSNRHNDNTSNEYKHISAPGCAASVLIDFWNFAFAATNLNSTLPSPAPLNPSNLVPNGRKHSPPISEPTPVVPFIQSCGGEMYCAVVDAICGFIISESISPMESHQPKPLLELRALTGTSRSIGTWKSILNAVNYLLGPLRTNIPGFNAAQLAALANGQHCELFPLGDTEVVSLLLSSHRIFTICKAILLGLSGPLDPLLRDQLSRCLQKMFIVLGAQDAAAAVAHIFSVCQPEGRHSPFDATVSNRTQRLALGGQLQACAVEGNWKKFKSSLKILLPKTTAASVSSVAGEGAGSVIMKY